MNDEEVAAARDRVLSWMEDSDPSMSGATASAILDALERSPSDLSAVHAIVEDYVDERTARATAVGEQVSDAWAKICLTLGLTLGAAQGWVLSMHPDQRVTALFNDLRTLDATGHQIASEVQQERTLGALFRAIETQAKRDDIGPEDVTALASSYWSLLDAMRPYWTAPPEAPASEV